MSHTNYAWTIAQAIETVLEGIADLTIAHVHFLPEANERQNVAAKYGRGVMIKLDNVVTTQQSSDTRSKEYVYTLRVMRIDTKETQERVMDLCEEIEDTLYSSQQNGSTWFNLATTTEYVEPADPERMNLHEANMTLEVQIVDP